MNEITLTINGKQVKGKEGDTILEVCRANNIDLPTLCHYDGLSDVAACRLCLVEIEGERRVMPACTYPARDGLVVQTHTEKLEKYRRLILELMFTEKNHLCAQCVASGECELQALAYRYQMDNLRYPLSWPSLPVDSVNKYLVVDHNRCVLCGRCIRACDEFAGIHTLDFGYRGWRDRVVADLGQPLGESSCISCGACFQVCPTGAIFSKSSAYKGRSSECEQVTSVCPICGVGCEIKAFVKDNRLVKIDSPDLSKPRGLLCNKGRFSPLQPFAKRVLTPLKRSDGKLEPCSLNEAIEIVGARLREIKTRYGSNSIAGVISGQLSNESAKAFKDFITGSLGSKQLDSLDGECLRLVMQVLQDTKKNLKDIEISSVEELLEADCLFVAGAAPLETHPVVGSYIVRAVKRNGANLIVLDATGNSFPYQATLWLHPEQGKEALVMKALAKLIIDEGLVSASNKNKKRVAALADVKTADVCKQAGIEYVQLSNAASMLAKARRCIVIYGQGVLQYRNPELLGLFFDLADILGGDNRVTKTLWLKPRGNSGGQWDLGVVNSGEFSVAKLSKNKSIKALYLLLGDDWTEAPELASRPTGVEFLVLQTSFVSPIVSEADVVLPSPLWTEVSATYMTLDGLNKRAARLVRPPEGIRADWELINEVDRRLSK